MNICQNLSCSADDYRNSRRELSKPLLDRELSIFYLILTFHFFLMHFFEKKNFHFSTIPYKICESIDRHEELSARFV